MHELLRKKAEMPTFALATCLETILGKRKPRQTYPRAATFVTVTKCKLASTTANLVRA
jgi:hypothetical protein